MDAGRKEGRDAGRQERLFWEGGLPGRGRRQAGKQGRRQAGRRYSYIHTFIHSYIHVFIGAAHTQAHWGRPLFWLWLGIWIDEH
jgi:hypothetical protein